ncbi:beta-propeller fold lactonase family protein [Dyadobacter arcticus]|uniref:DNA-binding beta-propeller fold protein YncE n=1 Tax=Dyadobacter arcticus TaxID=1078754 RepID=A0ABX0UNS0_9BACT|nr:beta-propeller fold lactonase family protein [Dyadobacter arcticus]NIJ54577.1 DNA-binding beta-propeller fold protein YncE [Dyadobacter arcticus]
MRRALFLLLFSVVLFSCMDHENPTVGTDILYIQTNNFEDNQNAVLAYKVSNDGSLEPLVGSPFLTKGSGVGNPMQILGPLDSDYELRVSADGKFLMAVNSGSNTIAVFSIKADGALEHVAGSPFPSNGQTPVVIDVSGNFVFVLNKSQDPLHATPELPNYSTFTIDGAGKLTPVPGAKFETTAGTSPSNALVSRDGKFLFGTDFLGFMLMPPVGTLRTFTISGSGNLTPVAGSPYVVPGMNGTALGLWQHPSGSVLYVGNPLQGMVNVYAINGVTGALTLQTSVAAGKAACWIRTNKAGDRMYVLNSADNTVQVYNTSNPMAPSSIQTFELQNSGPIYPGPGGVAFKTSQDFSIVFSSAEEKLFIVNQHTNVDFSIGNFNFLHSLKIAADGMVTEEMEPVQIPVPNTVRPKGSVIISR